MSPGRTGSTPAPNPKGRTWPGSGCSCWQGPSGLWWREAGSLQAHRPGSALSLLTCLAPGPWDAPPSAQALPPLQETACPPGPLPGHLPALCRGEAEARQQKRTGTKAQGPGLVAQLLEATLVAGQWSLFF